MLLLITTDLHHVQPHPCVRSGVSLSCIISLLLSCNRCIRSRMQLHAIGGYYGNFKNLLITQLTIVEAARSIGWIGLLRLSLG